MGEGRCLSLDCSEKARDQAVRVLRHFNVQPTARDVFSRCQVGKVIQVCTTDLQDVFRLPETIMSCSRGQISVLRFFSWFVELFSFGADRRTGSISMTIHKYVNPACG